MPLKHWFRRELRDLACDAIFNSRDEVLNRPYLLKLWEQHQYRQVDRSHALWAVLMYLQWRKTFES
jgi:hypothetical protein